MTSLGEEQLNHLFQLETKNRPSPKYMSQQMDLNVKMRVIVIDWLVEVALKFKLRPETFFLSVDIMDRFLSKRSIKRTKLQLLACTAMFLAGKFEEMYPAQPTDYMYISDRSCRVVQLLAMEVIVLKTLGFHLGLPTAFTFLEFFLHSSPTTLTPEAQALALFLLEKATINYALLAWPPSTRAAVVLLVTLETLTPGQWSVKHEALVRKTKTELLQRAVPELLAEVQSETKYQAIKKKYNSEKYHRVASLTLWQPPHCCSLSHDQ